MRRIHRSDANRAELVAFARACGITVFDIGRPVDLLVIIRGEWFPVELKSKDGKYTDAQKEFIKTCDANNAPVLTWRTTDDIVEALQ